MKKALRKALALCFISILCGSIPLAYPDSCLSEEERGDGTHKAEQCKPKEAPKERTSKTSASMLLDGEEISYTATAGEIIIENEADADVKGRLFYVAYERNGTEKSNRPVTFAFNGGPGAASIWLHLGGLGPKRVKLKDDGTVLPPPAQYVDNRFTWLKFTDLVFVDPVGTGFSDSIPHDEKHRKKFFGLNQDIAAVADFIRRYLNRQHRWISPIFLVGESYGTTRVSGLTRHLHQKYGIDLNGVILISPVLDYDTILFHPSNDLPYLLFLPTYTSIAWYHKMLPEALQSKDRNRLLAEVEDFCLNTYTSCLANGEGLDAKRKRDLAVKISAYTGLPESLVKLNNSRVSWMDFTKNLLKHERKLVGRMDGTVSGLDPDPMNPFPRYDPSLDPLYGPFASAMNAYVRTDLAFQTDQTYEFLNMKVNRQWDWSSGLTRKQGFIDVSPTLKEAMVVNSDLQVFIASGLYDLATPYFAAQYTISHMWLGSRRSNVTIKRYPAGHMIFTHSEGLEKLTQDVRVFYRDTLKGASGEQ